VPQAAVICHYPDVLPDIPLLPEWSWGKPADQYAASDPCTNLPYRTTHATNLVLLFALNRIPVSTHRLLCHWHRNSDGRLSCRWEPIPRSRILDPKQPVERFVSRDGSNIVA
jgi:hypothetical protein